MIDRDAIVRSMCMMHGRAPVEVIATDADGGRTAIISNDGDAIDRMIHEIDNVQTVTMSSRFTLKKSCKLPHFGTVTKNPDLCTDSDSSLSLPLWLVVDIENANDAMVHYVTGYLSRNNFPAPVVGRCGSCYQVMYRLDPAQYAQGENILQDVLHVMQLICDGLWPRAAVTPRVLTQIPLYGVGDAEIVSDYRENSTIPVVNRRTLDLFVSANSPRSIPMPGPVTCYRDDRDVDWADWMNNCGAKYCMLPPVDDYKRALVSCARDMYDTSGDWPAVIVWGNGKIAFYSLRGDGVDNWQAYCNVYSPGRYEVPEPQKKYYNRDRGDGTTVYSGGPCMETWGDFDVDDYFRPDLYIPTGIHTIDSLMGGLARGTLTVITGIPSYGKSTLVSQMTLNMIDDGYRACYYSGELGRKKLYQWLIQQAAGEVTAVDDPMRRGQYCIPRDIAVRVGKWTSDKLYRYCHERGGNGGAQMLETLERTMEEDRIDCYVIDNLMSIDLADLRRGSKTEAQEAFVTKLEHLAAKYKVAIILVAHPTKSSGWMRKNDISGSAAIQGAAAHIMIMHRKCEDLIADMVRNYKYRQEDINNLFPEGVSNLLEIAKVRDGSGQGTFVPLCYSPRSKTYYEPDGDMRPRVYGWQNV